MLSPYYSYLLDEFEKRSLYISTENILVINYEGFHEKLADILTFVALFMIVSIGLNMYYLKCAKRYVR